MIYNATLLRVDPPAPGPAGAALEVRFAMTPPTNEQARISLELAWDAVAVAYIPLARVPSPRPATEGFLLVLNDGDPAPTFYRVKQVLQRNSPTLGHILIYLAATS